jgi:hypothetical protein
MYASLRLRDHRGLTGSVSYFLDQRNTWNPKCFGNSVNRSERAVQLQNGSISSLGSGRKPTKSSGGNTGNFGQILSRPPTVLSKVFDLVDIWNQHSIAHTNKSRRNTYRNQAKKEINFLFCLILGNICLILSINSVNGHRPSNTAISGLSLLGWVEFVNQDGRNFAVEDITELIQF